MDPDRNCLSYWFPILEAAGLPVPRTRWLRTDANLLSVFYGQKPPGLIDFLAQLTALATDIGFPCFLRTGHTSDKHQWSSTCLVPSSEDLAHHVGALVEFSEGAGFLGLPHNVWVVRELLPTQPLAILPRYSGFPLVREARAFVEGGKVRCLHPYWPLRSIADGMDEPAQDEAGPPGIIDLGVEWQPPAPSAAARKLYELASTIDLNQALGVVRLAGKVAIVFAGDGAWSVDLLETTRGWFVTDMAVAEDSFHWPECAHAPQRKEGAHGQE